jgi:hypothetical protein
MIDKPTISGLPSALMRCTTVWLSSCKRAAAIMSLIQSAKLNGHEPFAYLRDVLTRLPTQPASRIEDLAPLLAACLTFLGAPSRTGVNLTLPGAYRPKPGRTTTANTQRSLVGTLLTQKY